MKLSSRTGLVKKFDMTVSDVVFDEFENSDNVIRMSKRHFDLDDHHYAVQKVLVPMHRRKEVNKLDGQKIFIDNSGSRESDINDGVAGNRPTVISGGNQRSFISDWDVFDFDYQKSHKDHAHQTSNNNTSEDENFDHSEDFHTIREAKGLSKEIIENANIEAARIIEEAQMKANEITNSAHQEGYQSGFAQVNTEIEVLRKIQVEMNKVKEEILKNTEPEIIELVKIIAEKMFTNGMVLDANILKDIVGRAINEASRIGNLKIYLNPGDLDKLKKLWRESELEFNGQKIQLASNSDVLPGGVYVEGDYGSVDGRIATQLDSVMELITDIHLQEQEVN